jgi:hypothetical protein
MPNMNTTEIVQAVAQSLADSKTPSPAIMAGEGDN